MIDIKVGDRVYITNLYLTGLDVDMGIIAKIDKNKIVLSNGKSYINTNSNNLSGFAYENRYTEKGRVKETLYLTNNEFITKVHIERCIDDYTKLVMKKIEKAVHKNKSITNLTRIISLLEDMS